MHQNTYYVYFYIIINISNKINNKKILNCKLRHKLIDCYSTEE